MDPLIVEAVERARDFGVAELLDFERVRTVMWRKLAPVLRSYDAMLCPTASDPVPRVEQSDSGYDRMDESGRLSRLHDPPVQHDLAMSRAVRADGILGG